MQITTTPALLRKSPGRPPTRAVGASRSEHPKICETTSGADLCSTSGGRADDLCPGLGVPSPPLCWGRCGIEGVRSSPPTTRVRVIITEIFNIKIIHFRAYLHDIGRYSHCNAQKRETIAQNIRGGGTFAILGDMSPVTPRFRRLCEKCPNFQCSRRLFLCLNFVFFMIFCCCFFNSLILLDNFRLSVGRAHTFAKAADVTKLFLLNRRRG